MDTPLAHRIFGCWNCFLDKRTVEDRDSPESVYLSREYLARLIPKMEKEYIEILATLFMSIDGNITNRAMDWLREANETMDFPNTGGYFLPRETEPIDAYLAKVPRAHKYAPKSRDSCGPSSRGIKGKMKRRDDDGYILGWYSHYFDEVQAHLLCLS